MYIEGEVTVPVRQQSGEMEKGRRQRPYSHFIHEEQRNQLTARDTGGN